LLLVQLALVQVVQLLQLIEQLLVIVEHLVIVLVFAVANVEIYVRENVIVLVHALGLCNVELGLDHHFWLLAHSPSGTHGPRSVDVNVSILLIFESLAEARTLLVDLPDFVANLLRGVGNCQPFEALQATRELLLLVLSVEAHDVLILRALLGGDHLGVEHRLGSALVLSLRRRELVSEVLLLDLRKASLAIRLQGVISVNRIDCLDICIGIRV